MQVKFKVSDLFNHLRLPVPYYATPGSAGADLCACIEFPEWFEPNQIKIIPTGVFIEVPQGYEAQLRMRSGLAAKKGLVLVNGVGTIDSDYRGEVKAIIANVGKERVFIDSQERIVQLVFAPVVQADFEQVEELSDTIRGTGGFGSTDKK